MSLRSRAFLTVSTLILTTSLIACGGEPPEKEMQQAEAAIAAARAAGADTYAVDEFNAAQTALAHGREAVTARDYRLALNHALDSRERALNAATAASAAMAASRAAADTAIGTATTALAAAKARIDAADNVRAPGQNLETLRAALADADVQLQKARTSWQAKDFPAATTAATDASARLTAMAQALDDLTPASRRRR